MRMRYINLLYLAMHTNLLVHLLTSSKIVTVKFVITSWRVATGSRDPICLVTRTTSGACTSV